MKVKVIVFIIVGILACGTGAYAERSGWNSREGLADRIITLRNWKLMEEFDLSDERAREVFSILDRFDKERSRLIRKRRKILEDLRQELGAQVPARPRLRSLMRELQEINVELARLPARECEALKPVFTLEERARYVLFSNRFARELRGIISRERR